MKVIERGHIYELSNKGSGTQTLTFFKDLPSNIPGHDGLLCQEVLRALIDRVLELFSEVPCAETAEILQHLRAAFVLFESRAARRLLEKSYAKSGQHVEQLPTDERGHVLSFVEQPK